MKKSILFILVLALMFSYCSNDNNQLEKLQHGGSHTKNDESLENINPSKIDYQSISLACLNNGVIKSLYDQNQLNTITSILTGKEVISSKIEEQYDSANTSFYVLSFVLNNNGELSNGVSYLDGNSSLLNFPSSPFVAICLTPCDASCGIKTIIPSRKMSCKCEGGNTCSIRAEYMDELPKKLLTWFEDNQASTCEDGYVL